MFDLPANLDALIVTNPYNILYLTGFKGISDTEREAILVLGKLGKLGGLGKTLITAELYKTEASQLTSRELKIVTARERNGLWDATAKVLVGSQKIGFEEANLTVAELNHFKNLLSGKDLIPTKNLIENLRITKSPDEIKKIEKAQVISQKALDRLLPTIKVGQTELDIKYRLEKVTRGMGSDGTSFDTIIASGPNSGIPHHKTSNRRLTTHDTLLLDFGAKYKNYRTDLSRTVFVGKPSDRQINIYNHVESAQKIAIAGIRHGLKTHYAFNLANGYFKKHKLEKYFTHTLGHGIGLEVHELPYLRHLSTMNYQLITNSMVFSVEPGLYFPWGGVRIEDLVVIQNSKPVVLGKTQSGIIVI